MPPEICPLLGTLDSANNPCPPVAFPSFENKCLVADDRDTLLLSDQATYCLSGGCRLCPRYRAAASVARDGTVDRDAASELAAGILASDQLHPEFLAAASEASPQSPTRWTWLSAAAVFAMLLLCGAVFAAWSGWTQVQAYLDQREAGQVESIASANAVPTVAYVVETATPSQPVLPPTPAASAFAAGQAPAGQAIAGQALAGQSTGAFPQAVTATPGGQPGASGPPVIALQPPDPSADAGDASAGSPNLLIQVPTRRPTPVFDIPTSTPPVDTPTSTPTMLPTLVPTPAGTPAVVFGAAQALVPRDGCTMISWNVENVKEVYFENLGVNGRGQKEICVDDSIQTYHLVVVLPDGTTQLYTTTVTMALPTDTPVPTPTFTPDIPMTPTWTPEPPTSTPAPYVRYGLVLNVNGGTEQTCAKGAECQIGLVLVNTGEVTDNLLASIARGGKWSAQLCRADGVCAEKNLALQQVGPSNAANITLRIPVPADADSGAYEYGVEGVSGESGGVVSSGVTNLRIVVP